jgi:hypothetical protein
MPNTRKSLIPEGTVKSPGTSLVDSIINRDRAQSGRPSLPSEESNIASNIAGNTPERISERTASRAGDSATPESEPVPVGGSAVVGSRKRIPMTTITVRIPTELNQWIADLVHARSADGITKQDVIVSALRLLRDHETESEVRREAS